MLFVFIAKLSTILTKKSNDFFSAYQSIRSDVDPGLAQDQDLSELVTNGCDVNGNGQNKRANVLWNNQYA